MEQKFCKQCNLLKDIDKFQKNGKYYKHTCKECAAVYFKNHRLNNHEYHINRIKNWKKENQAKIKEYRILDYDINKEKYKANKKIWYNHNKDIVVQNVVAYRANKLKTDSHFKMIENTRSLIRNAFKRIFTTKSKKTLEILGCTFNEFKIHLEKQFNDKMNWDNQGNYWVMDHIKPIALAKNEQDVILLNHYTNFQPMEKIENIIKGKMYIVD